MALAKGRSAVRTGPVTLHTQTAIHIAQLMTQVTHPKLNPLPQFPLISVVFPALFPALTQHSVCAWDEAIQLFLYSTAVACSAASGESQWEPRNV